MNLYNIQQKRIGWKLERNDIEHIHESLFESAATVSKVPEIHTGYGKMYLKQKTRLDACRKAYCTAILSIKAWITVGSCNTRIIQMEMFIVSWKATNIV